MSAAHTEIGVVIIGRNEGARLGACLESLQTAGAPLVYVDSGSTDGSVELAGKHGASVVELDLSRLFTAARARNEGLARLTSICPTVQYVQFMDGDCTVVADWIPAATNFLNAHPKYAVACGRRRERFPHASVFNQLCDLEWNTPIGDASACGGDAMMRVEAITQVDGFNETMIAGEEPELCVRLRQANWKIRRLDFEMTLHDAAMTRFFQWWRRNRRGGYAFALGASLHGKPPERHWIRETRSIAVWGIVLPLLIVALTWPTRGFSLLLLLCYPLLALKIFLRTRRPDVSLRVCFAAGIFTILGKFPQAIGVICCCIDRICATQAAIIEYKSGDARGGARLKIAYLVNVYPAPSHAFIRREILALEAAGHEVVRYSIRRFIGPLADPRDQKELPRTRVLLDAGWLTLVSTAAATLLAHPLATCRAMRATWRLARQSRRGSLAHLAYLLEASLLLRWTACDAVQHLHAHFGTNPAAVAMLCTLLGGPSYSFTVHGPEEFDQPLALGLRDKIAVARFVVAISDFGRSQLYRWSAPEFWDKIHVVRCGVDDHFLSNTPTNPPESPHLVCVGRLCAEKGQSLLVDAVAKLRDEKIFVELSFIGDGPMRDALRRRVAHHGLEAQVSFRGWQGSDAIRDAVLSSRALVLPSFAEGLPVVLMESLALSRPVVTTYVAGIPELVAPGINGWLVPAGSVEALAQALGNVLVTAPERLGEMGRSGAASVRQKHEARREAAVLATLFASSISNSGQKQ